MLNTAFAPRSPFQPYSKSPLPQLSLTLFLSMLHQPSKQSKGARTVSKPLHSGQKQNLQAFFENCAGNAANWLKILCRKWSIMKNFAQTENKPEIFDQTLQSGG